MKIKMLAQPPARHPRLAGRPGEVLDVDPKLARDLERTGHAELIEEQPAEVKAAPQLETPELEIELEEIWPGDIDPEFRE